MEKKIAIVNYDMGNIGSIGNILKKVKSSPIVTNSRSELLNSQGIILPGVGSFDMGIKQL